MSIEERLAKVERELAALQRRLNLATKPSQILSRAGSMADFPEFDEVVRLGREIRKADAPIEHDETP
jgi:hypothetical protein